MTERSMFERLNSLDSKAGKREEYIRSPLCGYPGNKWKSLDNILPMLPVRTGYCEPFGGSMTVLLARPKSKLEVYNDRYGGLTAFFRVMRDKESFERLLERLHWTCHSREEFLWCKENWENSQDDVERAARWYYATDQSFTRQMRAWARSTHGPGQTGGAFQNRLATFRPVHNRIQSVQVENQDWRQIIKDYDSSDMVFYLDPPYVNVDNCVYKHRMTSSEHIDMLEIIFSSKGFFALSGYPNTIYDGMPWDNVISWETRSTMEALAFTEENSLLGQEDRMKRGNIKEVLWIKEAD